MEERGTAGSKIALLSNVNMDFVIRMLRRHAEIYQMQGYGNELGILMNPASSYHDFAPDITFVVEDLMELLGHDLNPETAKETIDRWFSGLEQQLKPEEIYYISDAYLWGVELAVASPAGRKASLEQLWRNRLEALCRVYSNVRMLPYHHMIERMGEEEAFSLKMWYMGKILLSNAAQKELCGLILDKVRIETRVPKKVLLLDLDNTLWGGLAGENDHTPIVLSEEHTGLAYKNLQRVILQMQMQGVLLGIVSKNNESDALEIMEKHPHMVLRPEMFAARRINWEPKHENIKSLASELNLGMDSFVFWDDSAAERQLIKELLPQVVVPDFPDKPEDFAAAMAVVFQEYFSKPSVTEEDLTKTAQYAAMAKSRELRETASDFEDYLKKLEIVACRVEPKRHMERFVHLMNKTNQFNMTTRRYSQREIAELLESKDKRVYLYDISDRFGDNGVTAAMVADCAGDIPVLSDFVMSCRVMGRNIEYALVEDVETDLYRSGYESLRALYIPTAKNAPASGVYRQMGYECRADVGQNVGVEYEISLANTPERMYYVKMENSETKDSET